MSVSEKFLKWLKTLRLNASSTQNRRSRDEICREVVIKAITLDSTVNYILSAMWKTTCHKWQKVL